MTGVQTCALPISPPRTRWKSDSTAHIAEIADIIDRCPSKALQYELLNPISIVFEEVLDRAAAYDRGKQIGECEYSPSEKKWIISHTRVEPAYEGKGIARKLVMKVVEAARAKGVKICPLCPYAKKLMTGKEEFKDVMSFDKPDCLSFDITLPSVLSGTH